MELINRQIGAYVEKVAREYPVVTIVGPRQSGKTTLAKKMFPQKRYFSFENPDLRAEVEEDPRGFLERIRDGAIFDEFQRIPEITSFLQQIVDEDPTPGRFILTGSGSLEIMDRVSQSLVGRSATVELLPFSYKEIEVAVERQSIDEIILKGFYPPIHHRNMTASIWFENYVRNYLERDVRQLINIRDLNIFQRFLVLCAGRTGQLLNYSDLSSQLGLSHNTVKSWFSVLEASYIVFFLPPFFPNFTQRMVKTPKLYFYDTGLVSWLLSIKDVTHLVPHPLKGALFENYCVAELIKNRFNRGERSNLYFWRDKSGHEVDIIIDNGLTYKGVEVKSSQTYNKAFMKNLKYLADRDENMDEPILIWGREVSEETSSHRRVGWKDLNL